MLVLSLFISCSIIRQSLACYSTAEYITSQHNIKHQFKTGCYSQSVWLDSCAACRHGKQNLIDCYTNFITTRVIICFVIFPINSCSSLLYKSVNTLHTVDVPYHTVHHSVPAVRLSIGWKSWWEMVCEMLKDPEVFLHNLKCCYTPNLFTFTRVLWSFFRFACWILVDKLCNSNLPAPYRRI